MAQASKFTLSTSSEMIGTPEDISDEIYHLAPYETKLLTAVGMDSLTKPCTQPVHKYMDIQETPARSTLGTTVTNSSTTFVISHAYFAAGEDVQINEEIITLGSTSDNLTFTSCSRSAGAASAAAHVAGDMVTSLGKPRAQGAATATTGDLMIQPNLITNYTRIFSKTIVVSGTAQALDRYGRDGDEYTYQGLRQMRTAKKELEHSLIWGYATAAATTATAGTMAGIYERIVTNSSADLAGVAYGLDNCEDAVEASANYGGKMNLLCCGLYTKRIIDAWGQPYVVHNTDPMAAVNQTYGTNVSQLYVGGQVMDILVMDNLSAHVFQLDSSKIGVGPLQGRAFFHQYNGVDGDRISGQVIGEYTDEVPADRAHYIFTSCKFS